MRTKSLEGDVDAFCFNRELAKEDGSMPVSGETLEFKVNLSHKYSGARNFGPLYFCYICEKMTPDENNGRKTSLYS